jgi:hypothetical protein
MVIKKLINSSNGFAVAKNDIQNFEDENFLEFSPIKPAKEGISRVMQWPARRKIWT